MTLPAFVPVVATAPALSSKTSRFVCATTPTTPPSVLSIAKSRGTSSWSSAGEKKQSVVRMSDEDISDKLAWVDALPVSDITPGGISRVVLESIDVCIACGNDGQVYALGNKGPPLGIPLADGRVVDIGGSTGIQCSQYGTIFEAATGDVVDGTWVRKPFIISNVLRVIFKEPEGVAVFPVRDQNGTIQVLVNVNARAQYEQKYWKGLLDASGKADGGYY